MLLNIHQHTLDNTTRLPTQLIWRIRWLPYHLPRHFSDNR